MKNSTMTEKQSNLLFILPLRTFAIEALDSLVAENYEVLVLLHGLSIQEFRKYQSIRGLVFHCLSPLEYSNLSAVLNYGLEWAEVHRYNYVARIDGADRLRPSVFKDNFLHIVENEVTFAAFSRRKFVFQNQNRLRSRPFVFLDALYENTFIHSTFILKLKCGYAYDVRRTFAQDFAILMKYRSHMKALTDCHVVKGFSAGGASDTKRVEQLLSSIVTIVNESKHSIGWVVAVLPRIVKIVFLIIKRAVKYFYLSR